MPLHSRTCAKRRAAMAAVTLLLSILMPGPAAFAATEEVPAVDATQMPATSDGASPVPVAPPAPAVEAPAKPKPPVVTLYADINLTTQQMTVSAGGRVLHAWPISSGRAGFETPRGTFRPQWASKMHYSKKYDDAPMPHSVFFNGGVATHATAATGMLGRPASHGCIRLPAAGAATFYSLVHKHGFAATRIVVHGVPKVRSEMVATRRNREEPRERVVVRPAPRPYAAFANQQPAYGYGYRYGYGYGYAAPRPQVYVMRRPDYGTFGPASGQVRYIRPGYGRY